MESNHPIPQDVTGFQFKLIGSMTLKQFGYVAVGGVFALIFFLNVHPALIKFPLVILFGGAGAAMAFLPYEGRPLDVMAVHFFHALFTPNQYMYEKIGGHLSFLAFHIQAPVMKKGAVAASPAVKQTGRVHYTNDELKKNQELQAYLHTMKGSSPNSLDKKEQDRLSSYQALASTQIAPVQAAPQLPPIVAATPQIQPVQIVPPPTQQSLTTQRASTKEQLKDIVTQKQQLEKELLSLKEELTKKRQLSSQAPLNSQTSIQAIAAPTPLVPITTPVLVTTTSTPQPIPVTTQPAPSPQPAAKPAVFSGLSTASTPTARMARRTTFARNLTRPEAAIAGLPSTPNTPNIVVGIVKDPRGNAIPNLLVEIKNSEGSPIRAFKTNLLGQFASATPLNSGVYTIEFEDPKGINTISPIKIEAKGEILPPVEVISVDARELLRQQLFG